MCLMVGGGQRRTWVSCDGRGGVIADRRRARLAFPPVAGARRRARIRRRRRGICASYWVGGTAEENLYKQQLYLSRGRS